jgi:hypothetical protein
MVRMRKEIMGRLNTAKLPVRFVLTMGLVALALYFAVSFGESLGKALFYVSH